MSGAIGRVKSDLRQSADETVPEDVARALDASADDLLCDRTEDVGDFVKERRARLAAYLERKAASVR